MLKCKRNNIILQPRNKWQDYKMNQNVQAQAWGRKHTTTVDHICKEMVTYAKQEKDKQLHSIPRCNQGMWQSMVRSNKMYVLHKEGLNNKHWNIGKKLNQHLTATVNTTYGLTRKIQKTGRTPLCSRISITYGLNNE